MSALVPHREYNSKKCLTTLSSFFSGIAGTANKMQERIGEDRGKSKSK